MPEKNNKQVFLYNSNQDLTKDFEQYFKNINYDVSRNKKNNFNLTIARAAELEFRKNPERALAFIIFLGQRGLLDLDYNIFISSNILFSGIKKFLNNCTYEKRKYYLEDISKFSISTINYIFVHSFPKVFRVDNYTFINVSIAFSVFLTLIGLLNFSVWS